ncbi:hypothetical protein F0562_009177 [Nyssa sinensis]|uniref:Uncharacterized protein n=1 Tax=Nyssa sinensis TaxID=561372 RepID=A0A5J4ZZY4_9ASTE|nr:hypothetical protein F0562_009177 [Nyssa sinensis]
MADTFARCSSLKLMNEARGPGDVVCSTVINGKKRMVEGRNEKSRALIVSVPCGPVLNGMLRVVTNAQVSVQPNREVRVYEMQEGCRGKEDDSERRAGVKNGHKQEAREAGVVGGFSRNTRGM